MPHKKHILIASANPINNRFLELVKAERLAIRGILDKKEIFVQQYIESDLSFKKLVAKFQDNDKIEFFHYCGHSSAHSMNFEVGANQTNLVSKEIFSQFLSSQKNLKIVFLNSCSSTYIGQELVNQGTVEVVIETTHAIHDHDATIFAKHFYKFLAQGKTIKTSFDEAKNTLKGTSKEERGEARGIGFDNRNEADAFPWQLYSANADEDHLVNSWRLFESAEDQLKQHKGIKLLCVYPDDPGDYFESYFDAVKNILNAPDFSEEPILIKDFRSIQSENSQLIECFDCLLFFVNEDFNVFWNTEKDHFIQLLPKLKIGLLRCYGGLKDCKDHLLTDSNIEEGDFIQIPSYALSLDDLRETNLKEKISPFKKDFLPLLVPKGKLGKEKIKQTLKDGLVDLNFTAQKKLLSDTASTQFNFFIIEGTEKSAHEILIRRILNFSPDIKLEQAKITPTTIESNFEPTEDLTVDDILSFLAYEVLKNAKLGRRPKKTDIFSEISSILKTQNLIILISDLEFNKTAIGAIDTFWKMYKKHIEAEEVKEIKHQLFLFALNKGYSDENSFQDSTNSESNQVFSTFPMKPINKLEERELNEWCTLGLIKNMECDNRFRKIKTELWQSLPITNEECDSSVATVMGEICKRMECEEVIIDLMTLKK